MNKKNIPLDIHRNITEISFFYHMDYLARCDIEDVVDSMSVFRYIADGVRLKN